MASACINSSPAEIPAPYLSPSLTSDDPKMLSDPGQDHCDGSDNDLFDFEFRLHDPVPMLTADELFADGKLVPLHMASSRPQPEIKSPDPIRSTLRSEIALSDLSVSSPKASKCSSRWRELFGLKKAQRPKPQACTNPNPRSIGNLLTRNPRSSSSSLPLLRDSDSDSLSLSSSRHSLSSRTSSSDSCDLPRLSLDSDKPSRIHQARSGLNRTGGPDRVRTRPVRRSAVGAESPRLNSSGKVVFYSGSLGRCSSSPSSFNGGGPRVIRPRGMERSFSANVVRVNPVLNVPVCSLRRSSKSGPVFGLFPVVRAKGRQGGFG